YVDGVSVGRQLFAALPEDNRLRNREQERWSWENQRDGYFADMYVHPQEIDYNIETLFELIDASGLEFVGFSNPQVWALDRLLANAPALMQRSQGLSDRERYRLIELLDPQAITHYEFFLARAPLPRQDWSIDAELLAAKPEPSPCIQGWRESRQFFNHDYQVVDLIEAEWQFLRACDGNQTQQKTVEELLPLSGARLEDVRSLQQQQLILLAPSTL
ncbi:MAG TPA: SAM-dependent methyltransferase, partial [Crinalium sp.]